VPGFLAEAEARIDDNAFAPNTCPLCRFDTLRKKRFYLRHHIFILRVPLHNARLTLHVHQAHRSLTLRHRLERTRFAQRVEAAQQAGIARERIVVDPGFGFGKSAGHNLDLLQNLGTIAGLGQPVLVGLSRKSLFGKITGKPVADRVSASVAAALLAVERGAALVRVHDVAATRDALLVLNAIEGHSLAKS